MNTELNRILHQPIRTKIMAYLIANGLCTYTELKNKFNLSDGHMTTHMRELLEHNYVHIQKEFINNKPCTRYYITDTGCNEFSEYVERLKKIIEEALY